MEELLHRCNGILNDFNNNNGDHAIDLEEEQHWLEIQGKQLAQSRDARLAFNGEGIFPGQQETKLAGLGAIWLQSVLYANSVSASLDEQGNRIEELDGDESQSEQKQKRLRISVLLARLIRNLVADNKAGQDIFFVTVPATLKTLWYTTSFALEEDPESKLLTRALVQMLSNLITNNENLQNSLWNDHLGLGENVRRVSGKERAPSDLLCRLLDSRDVGIRTATQVLLINMTLTSRMRSHQVATNPAGAATMRSLLHDIDTSLEIDEKEEEEESADRLRSDGDSGYGISLQPSPEIMKQRQVRYEGLGVLYAFFQGLFKEGLFDQAYANLQPNDFEGSHIDQSIVSSAQITLLKLLDAHLHSGDANDSPSLTENLQNLTKSFLFVAEWAEGTMKATLKQGNDAPVDGRLVEVHVALILSLQCLMSLAMATETMKDTEYGRKCEFVIQQMRQDQFVMKLLNLMRTTSVFSPPISPFVPTAMGQNKEAPNGHVLSSTGKANTEVEQTEQNKRPKLDKLKRDLVALLGVIAFKRGEQDEEIVRKVQDLVREQGGLLDVLNLTQLDERNPYIRERAIFALRNLLQFNQKSQDVIAELKPIDPNQQ